MLGRRGVVVSFGRLGYFFAKAQYNGKEVNVFCHRSKGRMMVHDGFAVVFTKTFKAYDRPPVGVEVILGGIEPNDRGFAAEAWAPASVVDILLAEREERRAEQGMRPERKPAPIPVVAVVTRNGKKGKNFIPKDERRIPKILGGNGTGEMSIAPPMADEERESMSLVDA